VDEKCGKGVRRVLEERAAADRDFDSDAGHLRNAPYMVAVGVRIRRRKQANDYGVSRKTNYHEYLVSQKE
jgi:hypothetical protein